MGGDAFSGASFGEEDVVVEHDLAAGGVMARVGMTAALPSK